MCTSVSQNLNLNEVWIGLDKELSAPFQLAELPGLSLFAEPNKVHL